jgi:ankyrin repeat protein
VPLDLSESSQPQTTNHNTQVQTSKCYVSHAALDSSALRSSLSLALVLSVTICGIVFRFQQKRKLIKACSEHPQSLSTIRSVVKAFPEAVKAKTVDGLLPLHFPCVNSAPLNVVQFLVEQWPEAVKVAEDEYGLLPLHLACANAASLEVVQFLVEQSPEGTQATAMKGRLPLHVACRNKAPLDVIQFLVEQWPDAVKTADANGRLPLHFACRNKAPLDVVQFLVAQWPEAIKRTALKGRLPLHVACRKEAPLNVVQFLLKEWPDAINAKVWKR